jgi:hypothetical protein
MAGQPSMRPSSTPVADAHVRAVSCRAWHGGGQSLPSNDIPIHPLPWDEGMQ